MIKLPLILGLTSALALTACVDPNSYPNDPNARTKNGVAIGALSGAALGAAASDGNLGKAALGAVVGGALGGAIGNTLDRQAAELRSQLSPGVTVTNYGDYIQVNMPQDLLFATDSATLNGSLVSDLNVLAQNLRQYAGSTVQVVGHTDNTGAAAYNQDLSQRRASSVASVLINYGVGGNRVNAVGRGENQPIASNLTPEGRAKNRRVEILIRPNG